MVDLRRAVYTKEFEYENLDGSKSTIKLLPLDMSYLPKLFSFARKFREGMTEEETMEAMDQETVDTVMDMCRETLKRSIPSASKEDVNDFVVQHWTEMFPIIIELNSGKQKV